MIRVSTSLARAPFPLTPTLSPGERENGPLPLDHRRDEACSTTIGQTPIRRLLFPLPEGEGLKFGHFRIGGRIDLPFFVGGFVGNFVGLQDVTEV